MKLFDLKKIRKMPPPPKKISAHATAEWINVAFEGLAKYRVSTFQFV